MVKLRVTLFKKTIELEASENKSLLETCLDAGLMPPYSCQQGVCGICAASLLAGSTDVEPDQAGFILTCQAMPRSAVVCIDYDASNVKNS